MYTALKLFLLIISLFLYGISFAGDDMPLNKLDIKVDLEGRKITGTSRISLPAEQHTVDVALSGLKVIAASINDRPLVIGPGVAMITFRPEKADEVLVIEYEAEFRASAGTVNSKNPGVVEGNLISPEGIVLIDGWYPSMDGLSLFSLTTVLPRELEAVSEAEEILIRDKTETNREFSFVFPHPVRNISLIAGRYLIWKDTFNETEVFAYFLPEDKGLAKTYIEYAGKYLEMYEKLLGRYPFKRFSIVENILPTGYAMPTFTLLGQDVVRLPFIVETSLGHEILHQWFGCLVYIDYESGNWSEGLTTYLADHMYRELKGTGWDYRKQALISFQSYVTPENDFPLKSFTGRTGRVSAAIGYNKSAMVFHMLKNQVGEEAFYRSLGLFIKKNKFRSASWSDIKDAFESVSGENLDWFFSQWLERKGMLEIGLLNLEMKYTGSKALVRFELRQGPETYKLSIPVLLKLRNGEIRKNFVIDEKSTFVEIETEELPLELVIDDNYDLFRRLSDKEFPPVISRLLGDKKKIIVIPRGRSEEYASLVDYFKKEGFMDKKEEEIKYDDIKSSSFVVPDSETGMVKRLFGEIENQEGDFHVSVKNNPLNNRGVIAVLDSVSTDDMTGYVRRIPHYGGYSIVAFRNGKNILKSVDSSERGIRLKTGKEVFGIEIPRILSISDIIKKVSGRQIIYIGESHNRFEHHRAQIEVIRELYEANKNIAIGMEMFQKPFQQAIDDYIAGLINQELFLKKTEYFKHWGFDYNLYREILLFARANKIPVIALNISKEIVSKVAKEGVHALTGEELQEVPEEIDLSNRGYRARLGEIFKMHGNSSDRNFDFFYEAQVLWDESMAHNLDEFIRKNPERQVIVIAGAGHIAFGSGIPGRAFRLNNIEYSIILNDGAVERDAADFILFPSAVNAPESPELMVVLSEEEGKVKIVGFARDSVSQTAGLKIDDVILSLDDTKIGSVDDIRIFLLDQRKGDEITVKVSRKRFLFGSAVMEFKVTL